MAPSQSAIAAQAQLHHAYLLGLQLMVATREGPQTIEQWMFRLFRRQHLEKFLSSFEKLGLTGLPDAVACAQYHVLSNGVGGVAVEYMPESDTKAWVRYRYPRWWLERPGNLRGAGRSKSGLYAWMACAQWRIARKSPPRLRVCFRRHDRRLWILRLL